MMAGDHFPRKNDLLSTQGEIKKLLFSRTMAHFSQVSGHVLKTLG
jgi:hypothetical protein